jgi:hypothetical protein
MTFRFPFVEPHRSTYVIIGMIMGAFSLSVTRIILRWSIEIYGYHKMATLWFGLTILISFRMTELVFYLTLLTIYAFLVTYDIIR